MRILNFNYDVLSSPLTSPVQADFLLFSSLLAFWKLHVSLYDDIAVSRWHWGCRRQQEGFTDGVPPTVPRALPVADQRPEGGPQVTGVPDALGEVFSTG